ncbi:acyl-CoA dehydrogenase family protein [Gammaproteobacteria bacterium]|jgi:alkylation response protein AidB-like acyl-CoA dehydrogenase|nr:acyl-CoA dehydrogenase family protein [Gammaproteobacteria bacterium]|tara:strand:+ start:831 stop:1922 length:1092 start_codon:yes stop_codon:yes gene_type:complete
MNLDYNDEQNMLREQIQKFCESEYDFYKREEIVKSSNDFDENVWNLFAEQGWLSMPFSEQSGGLGFGPIELSILFEEFGKALVIEPYLSTVVLSGTLLDKSTFSEKNDLIEKICTGSIHISLAYAEVDNGYDYLNPSTTLDSKFVLNGTKTLVLNGSNAEKIIVTCTNDDTLNIVVLDANTPGVSINSFSTVDGQSCSEISFENVKLDKSNIISTGNDAENLLKETINLATLCICAEAVGCMESCYHKTLEYTKGREQFGQPISGFQVLQHRMVDMFIESELAKSLLIKAMLEVNNRSDEMYKHVSALKSYVGKSGKLSAKEAVQLHGGMGVSEEMMIGHYLKKMISIDALFGNADYHLKTFS